jgi:clan AA aspartic protease (TIGR02281 family)
MNEETKPTIEETKPTIKIDPGERLGGGSAGQNTSFILSGLVVLLLLGGGFLFWYYTDNKSLFGAGTKSAFDNVYAQLGIQPLPPGVARQPQISNRLEQLGREPCYTEAVVRLAQQLLKTGFPREAGTSLQTFARRCGNPNEVLPLAYEAFVRINDHASALDVADQLVNAVPSNGTAHYWRAQAHQRTGNLARALTDYMSTLQLVGNPRHLSSEVFYKLSQTYAALGRHCDSITPIEMYIALDPANRRTPQTTRIIADYAEKGKCDTRYATGIARVPYTQSNDVRLLTVVVNGVPGSMIFDTGASLVAITPQFAARAKISVDPDNHITAQTANGTTTVDTGYAESMNVGKAEAKGVVVAVHRGSGQPFGSKIDGLLGMSFLSRFNVSISSNAIELRAIPLR